MPRWLNTFVDDATIHEKISTILLVMFALRFYTYDYDVYLTLIMICSHSFGLLTDFKL